MQEEEEITIPAYESTYRKDKASNRGRIILSVKKTIKPITMQVKQGTEGRTVIVDTTKYSKKKKKKKVDVIYAPQEGVTHNKELYKNSIR